MRRIQMVWFNWKDGNDLLLQTLWNKGDGMTLDQIAAEFGISRSAISGKLDRLGLMGNGEKRSSKRKRNSTEPSRPYNRQVTRKETLKQPTALCTTNIFAVMPDPAPTIQAVLKAEPANEAVVFVPKQVPFGELRENSCRWPLGDPLSNEFGFCGAIVSGKSSYCAHHARIAYQAGSSYSERRKSDSKMRFMAPTSH